MKAIIFLVTLSLLIVCPAYSQFESLQKSVEEKIEKKVEEKAEEKPDDNTTKDKKDDTQNDNKQVQKDADNPNVTPEFKSYTKYDFIPGEEIIFFDDFAGVNIGDFPESWNTDSKGEVVTIDGQTGKWFKLGLGGKFVPDTKVDFPENITAEFDMIIHVLNPGFGNGSRFEIFNSEKRDLDNSMSQNGFSIWFNGGSIVFSGWEDGNTTVSNNLTQEYLSDKENKKVHISAWLQKQRVRVYFDGLKVMDIPRLAPKNSVMNRFRINENEYNDENFQMFVTNVRIAVGKPDTRNRLLTEGKLVTRGIVFASGSDKINPESYGVLKEIADVLKENPTIKIRIVGHTDSDGNPEANLELSKNRAISVKNELAKNFAIDGSRMETDGKGATEPVSANSTNEGKANNRRVEFIKL